MASRVDPDVQVTVPDGAAFLVLSPVDSFRTWGDNTGMGFGVRIEVVR